jgi:hypothetical protein
MKKILPLIGMFALILVLPFAVGAAKAGAQNSDNSPNELSGDGIKNTSQDEDFGEYGGGEGEGESPSELAGDGIPNKSQDQDFGQFGVEADAGGENAQQYMGEDVPQNQNKEMEQVQNKGEETMLQIQQTATNNDELEDAVREARAAVRDERGNEEATRALIRGEREDAEVALRAMVAAGPMLGEAQQQMTQLATQVGSQSDKALAAEVRVRERSAFTRFFVGGDDEAAKEMLQVAVQNRETIRQMEQLVEDCDQCDEAARETLREQIRVMEDEQARVEMAATEEQGKRGLFGFLFGWIGE